MLVSQSLLGRDIYRIAQRKRMFLNVAVRIR